MSVTLDLPPELEAELAAAASAAGVPLPDYILLRLRPRSTGPETSDRIDAAQRARGFVPPTAAEMQARIAELRDDGGRWDAIERAHGVK